ncbi:WUSCHEL-related homeobox 8-like [Cryptomeria japonica]|uniref:WUSCHEL-related homeobox 8-like n=1 Tax=Cryptomeria japonica TaxID=3369 RepID=UPI0025AD907B|nr:WUSCHEL-related homeobox 8-like [Cryptomeria japonica]
MQLQYSRVVRRTRWRPTLHQKQILASMWASGNRNPSKAQIAAITAVLQENGEVQVQPKNVLDWFRNTKSRERCKNEQSQATNLDFPTQSKQLEDKEDKVYVEDKEEEVQRTLQLFPLHPDRGGLLWSMKKRPCPL